MGQSLHPFGLALGALRTVRRLQRQGFDFDLIDAHFYYPDGVAAALLARWLGKPLIVTARGSDLNVFGRDAVPRALMRWAGGVADASVGVCQALVDVLRGWGLPPQRLQVVRNGVDTQRFQPQPQAQARAALGLDGAPLLLSVGHLVAAEGARHRFAGPGATGAPARRRAPGLRRRRPAACGAAGAGAGAGHGRAGALSGAVPNDRLAAWYSAADLLVLASRSEGWANVLLEAMACGTPVVATAVGGTAEVVGRPEVGGVVPPLDPVALAAGIEAMWAAPPDRAAVHAYAQAFGWDETSAAQLRLFHAVLARRRGGAPPGPPLRAA